MGQIPPNTVGSKSPTARSSIFLSPSAGRIVGPFRKRLLLILLSLLLLLLLSLLLLLLLSLLLLLLLLLLSAAAGVVLAIIADASMALILMRLRRELWRPVSGFSRACIFTSPSLLAYP